MRTAIFILGLVIPACSGPAPTNQQALANLKSHAEKITAAFAKNDFDTIADFTYPSLVKSAGGKQKYIEYVKDSLKLMAEIELTISSAELKGTPTEWKESNGEYFAVVPTLIRMNGPEGSRMKMNSGLIASSSDRGRTWKFVEANSKNSHIIKKIMPNFPDSLSLPKVTIPTIDE